MSKKKDQSDEILPSQLWDVPAEAYDAAELQEKDSKPESPAPSVGIGLVEQLSGANPYIDSNHRRLGLFFGVWEECCTKLRELIETKPLVNSNNHELDLSLIREYGFPNDSSIVPAPLSGSIEEQVNEFAPFGKKPDEEMEGLIKELMAKKWPANQPFWNAHRKAYAEGFLAGHNSQPSVQVLVDALKKILHMKREPGEHVDKWAFNRCWHLANDALQQFNTGEEKQEQEDQNDLWNKIVAIVAAADICKTDPADSKEIASWKNDVIERIKTDYTITKNK